MGYWKIKEAASHVAIQMGGLVVEVPPSDIQLKDFYKQAKRYGLLGKVTPEFSHTMDGEKIGFAKTVAKAIQILCDKIQPEQGVRIDPRDRFGAIEW